MSRLHLLVPALVCAVLVAVALPAVAADEEIPYTVRDQLNFAVQQKLAELAKSKNDEGVNNLRGTPSHAYKKVDEDTYEVSMNVDTADNDVLTTRRYTLTLKRSGADSFEVADQKLEDEEQLLHRNSGRTFHTFDKLHFNRGGLTLNGGRGSIAATYLEDEVNGFTIVANGLSYDYEAPEQQNYYQLNRMLKTDYESELIFDPDHLSVYCDPTTCRELLAEMFTGLTNPPDTLEKTSPGSLPESDVDSRLRQRIKKDRDDEAKARRENAFAYFRRPPRDGNRSWTIEVARNDNQSLGLTYDNWGGYEYVFWNRHFAPGVSLNGAIFSYYSKETMESTDPYDLEWRDEKDSRWSNVYKVDGTVDLATQDPEQMKGDVTFGIELKRPTRELPFFIASIPRGGSDEAQQIKPSLFVNSIRYQGQDLTWVRTGRASGIVLLPEEMPGGTRVELDVDFSSRVIYKVNYAYSQMARGGWLPFVGYGDMIDTFDLTVNCPSNYTVLGVGHKVSESTEGDVTTTVWSADSPVNFPTIIFGEYYSDSPEIKAEKSDGTEVPVTVYVDKVSMGTLKSLNDQVKRDTVEDFVSGSRGIRGKQLRPIGQQAVNAINYYREISGLDYPYGALNLVNDPAPALYGQSPASLIYLGSFVFRGEGEIAGGPGFGNSTGTSKFLKSVVAHEVGHQWWGSRIANANTRNYWFIESLAEFYSGLWLEVVYGPQEYAEKVEEWHQNVLRVDQRASVQNARIEWAGERPGAAYQTAVYNKGPYAFHMLREMFGDEKFFPAFKEFAQKLAAKREIVTRDIQQALEETLGGVTPDGTPYNADLEWFFDQWIRNPGIPEYSFNWKTRQAEDGTWIVEGKVNQRVVVGDSTKSHVLDDTYYRGLVSVTVVGRDKKEYPVRFPVEGPETPFGFKVPSEPFDVVLNKNGEMLSMDVRVNRAF